MSKTKVSIIIPHFNGLEIIDDCLSSLEKVTYDDYEIIIINNHSTDQSIHHIQTKFNEIQIIDLSQNKGYAGGCNAGAKEASGEYLVFLNNDTIHNADWIEPLVEYMDANNNIASCQPKIMNYFNQDNFDYAGASGGFLDVLSFPFCRGRILFDIEKDDKQYDTIRNIFWASGTAFITRKDIFLNIGGFDETMFAHMEEIDYHWKCHLMGYDVASVPDSVVFHKGGRTLDYYSPFKTYLNHRNSFLLLLTNFSIPFALLFSIPRLFLELVSVIYELCLGRVYHSFSILKSLIWLILNPHVIIKRIICNNRIRKINDFKMIKYFYKGSIVLKYFLFKKKTYSSL